MKLQVLCPAGLVTGGPEAMHQLAHTARRLGIDASMVYIDAKGRAASVPTPAAYAVYDVPITTAIDDRAGVLLVVSETDTRVLRHLKRARKAVWWLSVDNYFADLAQRKKKVIRWWTGHRPLDLSRPDDCLHLAQSAYAQDFLAKNGRPGAMLLTDYLRDDFIAQATSSDASSTRPARVAFNPKKGYETTQRLVRRASPDIEFVRLENMTPAGVIATLKSSAVYIDFGHHPGRDRFPREAALCGCCIVTGRRGSADYELDLPIPSPYKLDESGPDFEEKATRVIETLARAPQAHAMEFEPYRRVIVEQKRRFEDEVKAVMAAAAGTPAR
jgi:hypothetical protein